MLEDGCFGEAHILAPASLHRRIVVAYRLRRLGSANSLLWAVSLRQKQHSVVFNSLHVILEDFFLFFGKGLFEVFMIPCHVSEQLLHLRRIGSAILLRYDVAAP